MGSKQAASDIRPRDAEPFHEGIQCRTVQAKSGRGCGDHAPCLSQHSENMLPLHLLQSCAPTALGCVGSDFSHGRAKVYPSREDDRSFDEVLKFANVSWPVPVIKAPHSIRRIFSMWRPILAAYFFVKCLASMGMSSGRSRNGGAVTGIL